MNNVITHFIIFISTSCLPNRHGARYIALGRLNEVDNTGLTAIFILSHFDLARQIGKSVRLNLTIHKTSVQSDFNRTQVISSREQDIL